MYREIKRSGAYIGVGSKITLAVRGREDETLKFTVVERREGRISREAPMARAVIGKRVGDEIMVPTPRAERHYQIVSGT